MHPNCFQDVIDFHTKMGVFKAPTPTIPTERVKKLRIALLSEEFKELCDAIQNNDIAGVADGIADLIYVALGTSVSYGIDFNTVWKAVHESQMKKCGANELGKIQKPIGWSHPNIKQIIESQGTI